MNSNGLNQIFNLDERKTKDKLTHKIVPASEGGMAFDNTACKSSRISTPRLADLTSFHACHFFLDQTYPELRTTSPQGSGLVDAHSISVKSRVAVSRRKCEDLVWVAS